MSDEIAKDRALAPLIEHFAERLNLLFSYFFFTLEFEADDDLSDDPAKNARTWALETMQNACLHTTLIALRDLDDFLTPRTQRTKPDDIRASDFGMIHDLSFLSDGERTAINKNIAHATIQGALTHGFRWDIFEMATKAVSQCVAFLKWIEKNHGQHFLVYTAALTCCGKSEAIYRYVAEASRKRKQ